MIENCEFSPRQKAIRRLGAYRCHLKTMKKMGQTTPDEDRHIELLTRGLSDGLVDLEEMLAVLPVDGYWRSYL